MITARPILFSAPMIRALHDGSKTQTRRVVHARHLPAITNLTAMFLAGDWDKRPMPYGAPGDLLWVRETWAVPHQYDGHKPSYIPISARVHFQADGKLGGLLKRPSLFMPRWASRLTLQLTDVRVERLQDISEQDAMAEGVTKVRDACNVIKGFDYDKSGLCHSNAVTPFSKLWEEINGPGQMVGDEFVSAWDANPWVWALTFRVHQQNVDAYLNSRSEAA